MDFLDDIKTLEDKEQILTELDAVKRKDYSVVRKDFLDKILEVKDTLASDLEKIKVIKIILAVKPSAGVILTLDEFFQKILNKKVIFDIEVDPKLIGGIQIVFDGKYGDYSVLKLIDESK